MDYLKGLIEDTDVIDPLLVYLCVPVKKKKKRRTTLSTSYKTNEKLGKISISAVKRGV